MQNIRDVWTAVKRMWIFSKQMTSALRSPGIFLEISRRWRHAGPDDLNGRQIRPLRYTFKPFGWNSCLSINSTAEQLSIPFLFHFLYWFIRLWFFFFLNLRSCGVEVVWRVIRWWPPWLGPVRKNTNRQRTYWWRWDRPSGWSWALCLIDTYRRRRRGAGRRSVSTAMFCGCDGWPGDLPAPKWSPSSDGVVAGDAAPAAPAALAPAAAASAAGAAVYREPPHSNAIKSHQVSIDVGFGNAIPVSFAVNSIFEHQIRSSWHWCVKLDRVTVPIEIILKF